MSDFGARFRFEDDVANARFRAAEDAVALACRDALYEVEDLRSRKTFADFRLVGGMGAKTLDVKYDRWFESSGNVVFEDVHRHENGREWRGWAWSELDWLGIVGASCQWVNVFDMPRFRELVELNRHQADALGWKAYVAKNEAEDGIYRTHGFCVPERDLKEVGAMRARWPLGRYLGGSLWRG